MAVAFVAGLCFMAYGAGTLFSTRRKRRLLGRLPWQEAQLLGLRRNGLYVAPAGGGIVRALRSAKAPAPDPGSRARTVSDEKRTLVVVGEAPTELISARPPRSEQEEQSWRRLLDQPTEA